MSRSQIIKKIKETEVYFLDIAQERNPTAYKLMTAEIIKLKKFLGETDSSAAQEAKS